MEIHKFYHAVGIMTCGWEFDELFGEKKVSLRLLLRHGRVLKHFKGKMDFQSMLQKLTPIKTISSER